MPYLEILKHFAGDRGRHANHSRHAKHSGNAADSGNTERHHQQRSNHQRAERQSGDRVVRGTNHADEVARYRGEEESENCHDQGRDHCADEDRAAGQIARAGDEVVVHGDHAMITTPTPAKTSFALRSRSVRFVDSWPAADCFKSRTAREMPRPSCFRIRNRVYDAPTSIPPTAIGRTMEK